MAKLLEMGPELRELATEIEEHFRFYLNFYRSEIPDLYIPPPPPPHHAI
jgi:hypothetical protein